MRLLRALLMISLVFSAWTGSGQAAAHASGQKDTRQPTVGAHSLTILILGDSLSAAYNLPREDGWVALLRKRLTEQAPDHHWQIINASISGETTSGGLSRLPGLLMKHHPDWVLIELGANDGLRGLPLNAIRANLHKLVAESQQAGAKVVLLGIMLPPNYGPLYAEPFAQMFRQLAADEQLPLVPFLLAGVATDPMVMQADGLHPTSDGEPKVLDNVWSVVAPLWGIKPRHDAGKETPQP